jgi:hypothetical protein
MKRNTQCFAQRHMGPAGFGLWSQCRMLAHKTGRLFFDGRGMAARFKDTSKDHVYRTLARLVNDGWCELLEERKRRADGTWTPSVYRVLSHEDWVKKYGRKTCNTGWEDTLEGAQPVAPVRLAPVALARLAPVAASDPACRTLRTSPVAPARHSLIGEYIEKQYIGSGSLFESEQTETLDLDHRKPLPKDSVRPVAPVRQVRTTYAALVLDPRDGQWVPRRGFTLTDADVAEMQRLNANHARP